MTKINDYTVRHAREMAADGEPLEFIAEDAGVPVLDIVRAIRGETHQHIGDPPPVPIEYTVAAEEATPAPATAAGRQNLSNTVATNADPRLSPDVPQPLVGDAPPASATSALQDAEMAQPNMLYIGRRVTELAVRVAEFVESGSRLRADLRELNTYMAQSLGDKPVDSPAEQDDGADPPEPSLEAAGPHPESDEDPVARAKRYCLQGMPFAEIAAKTGLPEAQVRRLYKTVPRRTFSPLTPHTVNFARKAYRKNDTETVFGLATRLKANPYHLRDALLGTTFRNEPEPPARALRPEPDLE